MTNAFTVNSKYEQMVDILTSAIERGDFPEGQRITSENELSRQFGISRNTVREAISALVQQGYLTRTQGKGTFATGRRPAAASAETVAIFMHAHGHVGEPETRALVRNLQRHRVMPIVFDVDDFRGNPDAALETIVRTVEQGVSGLVVEEGSLPLLIEAGRALARQLPAIVALNYCYAPPLPVKSVVTDLTYGTGLGTRHLIELGRRRILFVIHRNIHADPAAQPQDAPGMYGDVCRGYTEAMENAGLGENPSFFFADHEFNPDSDDRARMKAVLKGPERPDAVFAFGDYRAKHVIDLAAECGLNVPEDLAVVGYWNTPWAEMTRVPLTSISIREDEIARIAVDKLLKAARSGAKQPEKIVVKPKLVVRASCGSPGR